MTAAIKTHSPKLLTKTRLLTANRISEITNDSDIVKA
jgi:hypothetical protein